MIRVTVVFPSTVRCVTRSPVNENAGSIRRSPLVPTTRNSDTFPCPNPQVNTASRSSGNRSTAVTAAGTSRNRGSADRPANPTTSVGSAWNR